MNFGKITVMIGEQGVGKSSVAKLYSLFSWLEKSLMRHVVTVNYVTQHSRFRKKYAAYNNMDGYFRPDTVLRFEGFHYVFSYEDEVLQVSEKPQSSDTIHIAKVMYIPAERNILGSVDHPSKLKGLSEPLMTFLDEYDKAKHAMKSGYAVPFGGVDFAYDSLNDIPKLQHSDYEVKLSAASSGYQSSLSLLLVSRYLSDMVRNSSVRNELSEKELKAMQKEVEAVVSDASLSENVKMASLRMISSRYSYSCFVNIVEEMELNLFPDSQKSVLYELIADVYKQEGNRLILTTHSPYIINYLTLAVKAKQLEQRAGGNGDMLERIYKIVPKSGLVDAEKLVVYELSDGVVKELGSYEGLPSDDNYLNAKLNDTNTAFDGLLEIEEELN